MGPAAKELRLDQWFTWGIQLKTEASHLLNTARTRNSLSEGLRYYGLRKALYRLMVPYANLY